MSSDARESEMVSDQRGVRPFPFVVGAARSGTTLVRALLDSHPEVAIPPESHFIPDMLLRQRRYEQRTAFNVDAFLSDVTEHERFRQWGLSNQAVERRIRSDPPRHLSAAIRRLYELYAANQRKQRYGDKTPAYVHHISLLVRAFPEGKVVHVIRDGRDVALSHLAHPHLVRPLPELALIWRRGVEHGRRQGKRLGPRRYREVRYEDLLDDPEGVTRAVCEFLSIEFVPDMLRYHERAPEIIRATGHPGAHGRIHLPPTKGLRDWRTEMAPSDTAIFEELAGGALRAFGYGTGLSSASVRTRLVAWRSKLARVDHVARKRVSRVLHRRHGRASQSDRRGHGS
jgi:Sulfotransferase family